MNKIPPFPYFKKLELLDSLAVERFLNKFLPYSDFNFANLWSWDIHHKMMICSLNNNLVVLFSDYVTGEEFLTFIGNNKVSETASELIDFSKKNYQKDFLKFIPEENAVVLSESGFKTKPDRDSYDYIYSVDHLAIMNQWTKNSKSKRIRQFVRQHPDYKVTISSIGEIQKDSYQKLFKKWANNKEIENHFELHEYKAFERILQIKDNNNIKVLSLYVNDILMGFTVYEIVSGDYAIAHFSKADIKYHSSMYDLLIWEEAKALKARKVKYYNFELDLGITGLRYTKEKYKPAFFLKKFILTN